MSGGPAGGFYTRAVFELRIEDRFSAAHALLLGGEREPLHGHDWRVEIVVAGPSLDGEELLCDFHDLERRLAGILAPFRNANLNETAPFDRVNPSAEAVARHVGRAMMDGLPPGVALVHAAIGEAPGCTAVWRPDPSSSAEGTRA